MLIPLFNFPEFSFGFHVAYPFLCCILYIKTVNIPIAERTRFMSKNTKIDYLLKLKPEKKRDFRYYDYYSSGAGIAGCFIPDRVHAWFAMHNLAADGIKQHHRFVLAVQLSGCNTTKQDGLVLTISKGMARLVFPFQKHETVFDKSYADSEMLCVNFVEHASSSFSLLPLKNQVFPLDNTDLELLIRVYKGCNNLENWKPEDACCALAWLLNRLYRRVSKVQDVNASLYQRICLYIENNLNRTIVLQDILKEFHISMTTLRRIFAREYPGHAHFTPARMIRRLKLNRSLEWILNTDSSIKEIAELCGYTDQFSFCRAFKQCYAMSPMQFRKQRGQPIKSNHLS